MNLNYLLKEKYADFWEPLYDLEKKEIYNLEKYLNYVIQNIKMKSVTGFTNNTNLLNFLMQKHISYVKEALSSLLLGNFNACASMIRIMMENYVIYILLKKYKKKELWKDYFFWSFYKKIEQYKKNDVVNKLSSQNLEEMLLKLREELSYSSKINVKNYGWLNRIMEGKNFTFGQACKLAEVDIYNDFIYLSDYIHSNDYISKISWGDMTTLTKFIFLIYTYMDKMLQTYAKRFTMRKEYGLLIESLFDSMEVANSF